MTSINFLYYSFIITLSTALTPSNYWSLHCYYSFVFLRLSYKFHFFFQILLQLLQYHCLYIFCIKFDNQFIHLYMKSVGILIGNVLHLEINLEKNWHLYHEIFQSMDTAYLIILIFFDFILPMFCRFPHINSIHVKFTCISFYLLLFSC